VIAFWKKKKTILEFWINFEIVFFFVLSRFSQNSKNAIIKGKSRGFFRKFHKFVAIFSQIMYNKMVYENMGMYLVSTVR